MRIYRPTYRDRGGRTRQASRWAVEFRDADGRPRRIAAFTDKGASEELGRKVERIVEILGAGKELPADLARWIEGLSPGRRAALAKVGVLEARQMAASRALSVLLEEFKDSLRSRERTSDWIAHVSARLGGLFADCGFETLSDLDADAIERHLHRLRTEKPPVQAAPVADDTGELAEARGNGKPGRPRSSTISARESNHRLQACRSFVRWAMQRGLLSRDPLIALRPVNARLAPANLRRALRTEDLAKLIHNAHIGQTYRGIEGPVRALAWRLAAQAGLRVGEIVALQVRDVDLQAQGGPTLTIRACVSKNRTEARLPLLADLAADLEPFLEGKLPTATVLPLPRSFKTKATNWLRFDLAWARIAYEDESGRVADVHALRSAFVAVLVRSGANVKAVQRLARHSSPVMTLGVYARLDARDEREAIEGLPSLKLSPSAAASADVPDQPWDLRATGTDGRAVLASCLASQPAEPRGSERSGAGAPPCWSTEEATAEIELVEDRGLEPLASEPAASSQVPIRASAPADAGPGGRRRLGVLLGVSLPEDADLALVVSAWPTLPEPLRVAVLALVCTARL